MIKGYLLEDEQDEIGYRITPNPNIQMEMFSQIYRIHWESSLLPILKDIAFGLTKINKTKSL